jgi:hypothetical protein
VKLPRDLSGAELTTGAAEGRISSYAPDGQSHAVVACEGRFPDLALAQDRDGRKLPQQGLQALARQSDSVGHDPRKLEDCHLIFAIGAARPPGPGRGLLLGAGVALLKLLGRLRRRRSR